MLSSIVLYFQVDVHSYLSIFELNSYSFSCRAQFSAAYNQFLFQFSISQLDLQRACFEPRVSFLQYAPCILKVRRILSFAPFLTTNIKINPIHLQRTYFRSKPKVWRILVFAQIPLHSSFLIGQHPNPTHNTFYQLDQHHTLRKSDFPSSCPKQATSHTLCAGRCTLQKSLAIDRGTKSCRGPFILIHLHT